MKFFSETTPWYKANFHTHTTVSDGRKSPEEVEGFFRAAGYDIVALDDYTLIPGGVLKIPTGIKAFMNNDEVLLIVIRSSFGFKYNARLCNQVGVIDSDYYNNIDNEGHIFISLQNEGNKDLVIKKGEHFAQGIFTKFLTADNEKEVTTIRQGGIGSTNEGGK